MQPGWQWKLPRVLFALNYALNLWLFWRSRRDFTSCLAFASSGFLAYFMFNNGVHENHLFAVAIACALAVLWQPQELRGLGYWVVASLINHLLFYGFTGEAFPYKRTLIGLDFTVFFAALNVLAYALTVWTLHARLSARAAERDATVRA